MSDDADFPGSPVPLMSALKARDIGRAHHGWATYLRGQGLMTEAQMAEQQAQFWLAYAIAISQIPPGAVDE